MFEKTEVALKTRLAETEVLPYTSLTEMSVHSDRLRHKVDRLPFNRSVLSVERKTTRRQMSATRTEARIVSRHFIEQKRLKDEA